MSLQRLQHFFPLGQNDPVDAAGKGVHHAGNGSETPQLPKPGFPHFRDPEHPMGEAPDQVLRTVLDQQSSPVEKKHLVATGNLVQILGGYHHPRPLARQLFDQPPYLPAGYRSAKRSSHRNAVPLKVDDFLHWIVSNHLLLVYPKPDARKKNLEIQRHPVVSPPAEQVGFKTASGSFQAREKDFLYLYGHKTGFRSNDRFRVE